MLSIYRTDFRANLRLAWPIILGQLGQISVNIIDNLMVGDLGAEALAAVSLGISIFVIFLVVGMGISMALQPLVAESDGMGDSQGASFSFKHSLVINIIFALLSILLIESFIPFMDRLGQDPGVVDLAIPYLRVCSWSMVPMMIFQGFRGLSEGLSETTAPMVAILFGNVLNVLANYMLIYGNWGAPALGVEGAAFGTLFGRTGMMLLLIFFMRYWKTGGHNHLWSYLVRIDPFKFSKWFFKKVLRLGVPTSLQMLFEVGAFAAAALMMGMIGAPEQAAHQITINAVSATFMVCVGISVAATVRVGNALGRGDGLGKRRAGIAAILQVVLFMTLAAVLIGWARYFIPALYIDDARVIEIAADLFLIAAIFQISDGVQVAAIGALRGLQDIWWPTAITFFSYLCIGLPFSWYSAFELDWGYQGIWIGLLIGLSLSAILNTMRFMRLT
ncbi:MAG: MATE family efflux transporter [Flavobacteriales bacterium]|nr:MATE family efflux transporter [Flavobacteriales bacterium]